MVKEFEEERQYCDFQTDKSGRMAVDTKDNYVKATVPHVTGDAVVTDDDHVKSQKMVNAHSSMWVRITRAGELTGTSATRGEDRVRNSMRVHNHGYAPLFIHYGRTTNQWMTRSLDPPLGPSVVAVQHTTINSHTTWAYFLGLSGRRRRRLA